MTRSLGLLAISAGVFALAFWLGRMNALFPGVAHAQVAGGGIPVGTNVSSSAGGSKIFLANTLRSTLLCQNIGATNSIYLTFGQVPTTTNGFLLSANGGYFASPADGCTSKGAGSYAPGMGCVPTGTVSAIASGSGTNTLICWED